MVETRSTMAPIGMNAPNFSLPNTEGNLVSLRDLEGAPALLIMFLCNHCPFVKHLQMELADLIGEYQGMGLVAVAINSNDFIQYPEDNPDRMAEEVSEIGYTFPYLVDEDQSVAKDYRAACTPDFFLFDDQQRLFYRGQFDGSRPGNNVAVTGVDLKRAIKSALKGEGSPRVQNPSIGCNIKWKNENQPDYF
ncbi:MAG: thioredoxin family protein [Longimicrobiales bacterium]|nr:thioredoxin family protein [Longimicrobiales bacterium]